MSSMKPALKLTVTARDLSARAATGVGLVAPFDFALDAECWRWLPKNTALFVTRTPQLRDAAVTSSLARDVSDAAAVVPAVQSLLAAGPAGIAYACTSGSFVDGLAGEQRLRQTILEAGATQAVTTSGALLEALRHLGVRRLAIATPYNADLTHLLTGFLHEAEFEVVSAGYLDREAGIATIRPAAIRRLALAVDRPEADALFFSCTNLRTYDLIADLENQLGKPVLSANQVTMWAALKAAGIRPPALPQRLFRR
jgi:maleate isomerase